MIHEELVQLEQDLEPVWEALILAAQRPSQRAVRKAHKALAVFVLPYKAQRAAKSLDRPCPNGRDVFANMIDALPRAPRTLVI